MAQRIVTQWKMAWKSAWSCAPLDLRMALVITLVASYLFSLFVTWGQWGGFAAVTLPFTLFILVFGPTLLRSSTVMRSKEVDDLSVTGTMVPRSTDTPYELTEPGLQLTDECSDEH